MSAFSPLPSQTHPVVTSTQKVEAVWYEYWRGVDRFVRSVIGSVIQAKPATSAAASINIPAGTGPAAPNDGDMWFDGTDLHFRVGGITKTINMT